LNRLLPERFEFLEELGAGRFGRVILAHDKKLSSLVAVKRLHSATPREERQVEFASDLDHPNVVRLLDMVVEEDRPPLLVFQYHYSITLGEWLTANVARASENDVANLFAQIAEAVDYVHTRGVFHRDLSPNNILLELPKPVQADADEVVERIPLNRVTPLVTDFGLSKRPGQNQTVTGSGDLFGTPGYIAPEMAANRVDVAGPGLDLFALGVLLYETLTGVNPFRGSTISKSVQLALRFDPPSPLAYRPELSKRLANICLHCLHKDPRRRYASAADLANDLGNYQNPSYRLKIKPIPQWVRVWDWGRKHPAKTAAAVLVGAVVSFLIVFLTLSQRDAARLQQAVTGFEETVSKANAWAEQVKAARKKEQDELAERRSDGHLLCARQALRAGDYREAMRHLDSPETQRGFVWYQVHRMLHPEQAAWRAHDGAVCSVSISPNGKVVATGGADGFIRIWDPKGREVAKLQGHKGKVNAVAFWPQESDVLLSAGDDGLVRLWTVSGAKEVPTPWIRHDGPVVAIAFMDNQEKQERHGLLWSAGADGQVRCGKMYSPHEAGSVSVRQPAGLAGLAAIADKQALLTLGLDGAVTLWEPGEENWKEKSTWPVRILPEGRHFLAVATLDTSTLLAQGHSRTGMINVRSDLPSDPTRWVAHREGVTALTWMSDGRALVSAGRDGSVLLWTAADGSAKQFCVGHANEVTALATALPGGKPIDFLVSADQGGWVKVTRWQDDPAQPVELQLNFSGPWQWDKKRENVDEMEVWSPDKLCRATLGRDRIIRIFSRHGQELLTLEINHEPHRLGFSPDGTMLVAETRKASMTIHQAWGLLSVKNL
jgi:WD40 repeat protein